MKKNNDSIKQNIYLVMIERQLIYETTAGYELCETSR